MNVGRSGARGGKSRPGELRNPYCIAAGDGLEGDEPWALRSRLARGLLAGGVAAGMTAAGVLMASGNAFAQDATGTSDTTTPAPDSIQPQPAPADPTLGAVVPDPMIPDPAAAEVVVQETTAPEAIAAPDVVAAPEVIAAPAVVAAPEVITAETVVEQPVADGAAFVPESVAAEVVTAPAVPEEVVPASMPPEPAVVQVEPVAASVAVPDPATPEVAVVAEPVVVPEQVAASEEIATVSEVAAVPAPVVVAVEVAASDTTTAPAPEPVVPEVVPGSDVDETTADGVTSVPAATTEVTAAPAEVAAVPEPVVVPGQVAVPEVVVEQATVSEPPPTPDGAVVSDVASAQLEVVSQPQPVSGLVSVVGEAQPTLSSDQPELQSVTSVPEVVPAAEPPAVADPAVGEPGVSVATDGGGGWPVPLPTPVEVVAGSPALETPIPVELPAGPALGVDQLSGIGSDSGVATDPAASPVVTGPAIPAPVVSPVVADAVVPPAVPPVVADPVAVASVADPVAERHARGQARRDGIRANGDLSPEQRKNRIAASHAEEDADIAVIRQQQAATYTTAAVPPANDPAVTDPAVTDPAVTDPAVIDPVVTTPEVTTPEVTTPVVTDPVVTAPAVTDPVMTTPEVTTPAVTDPMTSAPVIDAAAARHERGRARRDAIRENPDLTAEQRKNRIAASHADEDADIAEIRVQEIATANTAVVPETAPPPVEPPVGTAVTPPSDPQESSTWQRVDGETVRNFSYDAATDTTTAQFRRAHNDAPVTDTYDANGTRTRVLVRPNGTRSEQITNPKGVTRTIEYDADGEVVGRERTQGEAPIAPTPPAPAAADTASIAYTNTDPNAALVDYVTDPGAGTTVGVTERTDGGTETRQWNADNSFTKTVSYDDNKQIVVSVDEQGARNRKVYKDGELVREVASIVAAAQAPTAPTPEQLAQTASTVYVTGNGERAVQDVLVDTSTTDARITEAGVDVRRTVAETGTGLTVRDDGRATTYREVAADGQTTVRRIVNDTDEVEKERTFQGTAPTPIALPTYVQNDPNPVVTTAATPAGQALTTTTWSDGTTLAESTLASGDAIIQTSLPTGLETTQRRDVNGDVVTLQTPGAGPTELSTRDTEGAGVQQVLPTALADLPIAAVEVGTTTEAFTDVDVTTRPNGTEVASFDWGDNAVTLRTKPNGATGWNQEASGETLESLTPEPVAGAADDEDEDEVDWERWNVERRVDPAGELVRRAETRVGDSGSSRADGLFVATAGGGTESSWESEDLDGRQLSSLDVGADGSIRQISELDPEFGPDFRSDYRADAEGNVRSDQRWDETDIGNGVTTFQTRQLVDGDGYVRYGRRSNDGDPMRIVYTDAEGRFVDGRPTLTDEQKKAAEANGYVIAGAAAVDRGEDWSTGDKSLIMLPDYAIMEIGDGQAKPPAAAYAEGTGQNDPTGTAQNDGDGDERAEGVFPDRPSSGAAGTVGRWAGSRIAQGFGADGLAASTVGNATAGTIGLIAGEEDALRIAGGAIADEAVTSLAADALPTDLAPGATAVGNVVGALVSGREVDITNDIIAPVGREVITNTVSDAAGSALGGAAGYAGAGALRLAGQAIFGGEVTTTQVVDEAIASGAGAACSAVGTPALGAACYGLGKLITGLIGGSDKPDDLAEEFADAYDDKQDLTDNPVSNIVDAARSGDRADERLWQFQDDVNLAGGMQFNPDQAGTLTRQAILATTDVNTTTGGESQRREDFGNLAAELATDTPELKPFARYLEASAEHKERSTGRGDAWHQRQFNQAASRLNLTDEFGVTPTNAGNLTAAQARAIIDESGARLGYDVYNPLSGGDVDPTELRGFDSIATDRAAAAAATAAENGDASDAAAPTPTAPTRYSGSWWKDFYAAQDTLADKDITDVVENKFGTWTPDEIDNLSDDEIYDTFLRATYTGLDDAEGDPGKQIAETRQLSTQDIINQIRQYGVDDPTMAGALIGDGLAGMASPAYEAPREAPLLQPKGDPEFDVADGVANVFTSAIDAVESLTPVGDPPRAAAPDAAATPAGPARGVPAAELFGVTGSDQLRIDGAGDPVIPSATGGPWAGGVVPLPVPPTAEELRQRVDPAASAPVETDGADGEPGPDLSAALRNLLNGPGTADDYPLSFVGPVGPAAVAGRTSPEPAAEIDRLVQDAAGTRQLVVPGDPGADDGVPKLTPKPGAGVSPGTTDVQSESSNPSSGAGGELTFLTSTDPARPGDIGEVGRSRVVAPEAGSGTSGGVLLDVPPDGTPGGGVLVSGWPFGESPAVEPVREAAGSIDRTAGEALVEEMPASGRYTPATEDRPATVAPQDGFLPNGTRVRVDDDGNIFLSAPRSTPPEDQPVEDIGPQGPRSGLDPPGVVATRPGGVSLQQTGLDLDRLAGDEGTLVAGPLDGNIPAPLFTTTSLGELNDAVTNGDLVVSRMALTPGPDDEDGRNLLVVPRGDGQDGDDDPRSGNYALTTVQQSAVSIGSTDGGGVDRGAPVGVMSPGGSPGDSPTTSSDGVGEGPPPQGNRAAAATPDPEGGEPGDWYSARLGRTPEELVGNWREETLDVPTNYAEVGSLYFPEQIISPANRPTAGWVNTTLADQLAARADGTESTFQEDMQESLARLDVDARTIFAPSAATDELIVGLRDLGTALQDPAVPLVSSGNPETQQEGRDAATALLNLRAQQSYSGDPLTSAMQFTEAMCDLGQACGSLPDDQVVSLQYAVDQGADLQEDGLEIARYNAATSGSRQGGSLRDQRYRECAGQLCGADSVLSNVLSIPVDPGVTGTDALGALGVVPQDVVAAPLTTFLTRNPAVSELSRGRPTMPSNVLQGEEYVRETQETLAGLGIDPTELALPNDENRQVALQTAQADYATAVREFQADPSSAAAQQTYQDYLASTADLYGEMFPERQEGRPVVGRTAETVVPAEGDPSALFRQAQDIVLGELYRQFGNQDLSFDQFTSVLNNGGSPSGDMADPIAMNSSGGRDIGDDQTTPSLGRPIAPGEVVTSDVTGDLETPASQQAPQTVVGTVRDDLGNPLAVWPGSSADYVLSPGGTAGRPQTTMRLHRLNGQEVGAPFDPAAGEIAIDTYNVGTDDGGPLWESMPSNYRIYDGSLPGFGYDPTSDPPTPGTEIITCPDGSVCTVSNGNATLVRPGGEVVDVITPFAVDEARSRSAGASFRPLSDEEMELLDQLSGAPTAASSSPGAGAGTDGPDPASISIGGEAPAASEPPVIGNGNNGLPPVPPRVVSQMPEPEEEPDGTGGSSDYVQDWLRWNAALQGDPIPTAEPTPTAEPVSNLPQSDQTEILTRISALEADAGLTSPNAPLLPQTPDRSWTVIDDIDLPAEDPRRWLQGLDQPTEQVDPASSTGVPEFLMGADPVGAESARPGTVGFPAADPTAPLLLPGADLLSTLPLPVVVAAGSPSGSSSPGQVPQAGVLSGSSTPGQVPPGGSPSGTGSTGQVPPGGAPPYGPGAVGSPGDAGPSSPVWQGTIGRIVEIEDLLEQARQGGDLRSVMEADQLNLQLGREWDRYDDLTVYHPPAELVRTDARTERRAGRPVNDVESARSELRSAESGSFLDFSMSHSAAEMSQLWPEIHDARERGAIVALSQPQASSSWHLPSLALQTSNRRYNLPFAATGIAAAVCGTCIGLYSSLVVGPQHTENLAQQGVQAAQVRSRTGRDNSARLRRLTIDHQSSLDAGALTADQGRFEQQQGLNQDLFEFGAATNQYTFDVGQSGGNQRFLDSLQLNQQRDGVQDLIGANNDTFDFSQGINLADQPVLEDGTVVPVSQGARTLSLEESVLLLQNGDSPEVQRLSPQQLREQVRRVRQDRGIPDVPITTGSPDVNGVFEGPLFDTAPAPAGGDPQDDQSAVPRTGTATDPGDLLPDGSVPAAAGLGIFAMTRAGGGNQRPRERGELSGVRIDFGAPPAGDPVAIARQMNETAQLRDAAQGQGDAQQVTQYDAQLRQLQLDLDPVRPTTHIRPAREDVVRETIDANMNAGVGDVHNVVGLSPSESYAVSDSLGRLVTTTDGQTSGQMNALNFWPIEAAALLSGLRGTEPTYRRMAAGGALLGLLNAGSGLYIGNENRKRETLLFNQGQTNADQIAEYGWNRELANFEEQWVRDENRAAVSQGQADRNARIAQQTQIGNANSNLQTAVSNATTAERNAQSQYETGAVEDQQDFTQGLSNEAAGRVGDKFGISPQSAVEIDGVRYPTIFFRDRGEAGITNPVLATEDGSVNPGAIEAFVNTYRELPAVSEIRSQVYEQNRARLDSGTVTTTQVEQQVRDEVGNRYGRQIQDEINREWARRTGNTGNTAPLPPAPDVDAPAGSSPTQDVVPPELTLPQGQQGVPAPPGGYVAPSVPASPGTTRPVPPRGITAPPGSDPDGNPQSSLPGGTVSDDLVAAPSATGEVLSAAGTPQGTPGGVPRGSAPGGSGDGARNLVIGGLVMTELNRRRGMRPPSSAGGFSSMPPDPTWTPLLDPGAELPAEVASPVLREQRPGPSTPQVPADLDSLVAEPEVLRPVPFDPGVDSVRPVGTTATGELVEMPVRVLPGSGGTGSGTVAPSVTIDVPASSVRPLSGAGLRAGAGFGTELVGNVVSEVVVRPALIEGGVLQTTQAEENLAALMEGRVAAPRDVMDTDTLNFRTYSGMASAGAGGTVAAGPAAGGAAVVASVPFSLLNAVNQTAPGAQGRNDAAGDVARSTYLSLPEPVRNVIGGVGDLMVDGADAVSGGAASDVLTGSAAEDLVMRWQVMRQAERVEEFSAAMGRPIDLTGASVDTVARAYQDSGLAAMDENPIDVDPYDTPPLNVSELPAPDSESIPAQAGGAYPTVRAGERVLVETQRNAESVRRSGYPLCGADANAVECVPEESINFADPASKGELRMGSGGVRSTDLVTGRVREFPLCSTDGQRDCVPEESIDPSKPNSVGTVRRGDGGPAYTDSVGRRIEYRDCDGLVVGQVGCLRPGTNELVVGTGRPTVRDSAGRTVETVTVESLRERYDSMTPEDWDRGLRNVPGYQPPPVAVGAPAAAPEPQSSPALRNPVESMTERAGDAFDAAGDSAERLPYVGGAVGWLRRNVPGLGGDGDPNR